MIVEQTDDGKKAQRRPHELEDMTHLSDGQLMLLAFAELVQAIPGTNARQESLCEEINKRCKPKPRATVPPAPEGKESAPTAAPASASAEGG